MGRPRLHLQQGPHTASVSIASSGRRGPTRRGAGARRRRSSSSCRRRASANPTAPTTRRASTWSSHGITMPPLPSWTS
eukprot:11155009-Lingulodinium_polyedra.AAC.1